MDESAKDIEGELIIDAKFIFDLRRELRRIRTSKSRILLASQYCCYFFLLPALLFILVRGAWMFGHWSSLVLIVLLTGYLYILPFYDLWFLGSSKHSPWFGQTFKFTANESGLRWTSTNWDRLIPWKNISDAYITKRGLLLQGPVETHWLPLTSFQDKEVGQGEMETFLRRLAIKVHL